ncbi:putative tetratricopeptide-like helical domain superfamily [Helianthus annuus]|nr:putative tetratricopeptide-like helical domain superfamily [Helianthus annuus]
MANRELDPSSLGYLTRKETKVKLPRPRRVKNKTPTPIQITAEQIPREARERQEAEIRPPKQKITDRTELGLQKRKEFEDLIRRVRWNKKYATWEESHKDFNRARSVWERALDIFNKYIEIELQLGNIDRCRKLYEKYLEWSPENCYAWSRYTELERSLSETERARALFELAIAQPALDMPELLWKAYINFEIAEGEFERTRQLYERLLDRTKHLKVWITYAKFEASAIEEVEQQEELRCVLSCPRI